MDWRVWAFFICPPWACHPECPPFQIILLYLDCWTMGAGRLNAGRNAGNAVCRLARCLRWWDQRCLSSGGGERLPTVANHLHRCSLGGGKRLERHSLRGAHRVRRRETHHHHHHHHCTITRAATATVPSTNAGRSHVPDLYFPHQSYHAPSRRSHWLAMPLAARTPEQVQKRNRIWLPWHGLLRCDTKIRYYFLFPH